MKRITFTLIYFLFFSTYAHAWVVTAGFEGGTIGQEAIGPDALDKYGPNTTFTDEYVRTGSRSAKMTAIQGSTEWGGYKKFPSNLGEGDEIWMRYYMYFPKGFDFSCTQCIGLKTMRIHTRSAGGINQGYIDVLIGGGKLVIWNEVSSDAGFGTYWYNKIGQNVPKMGTKVPTGEWHAVEQYVKFSATPGNAIYRVWQNGTLIFEDTANVTLMQSSSLADLNYIWGYWNGAAPRTQSAYFDDFVLTSERPGNTDAHGNHFIGLDPVAFVAPPNPPSIR